MQLTVEAVSKNGKGFKAVGKDWFNADKNFKGDFSKLAKGQIIEIPEGHLKDEKWVLSYTVVGASQANPANKAIADNKSAEIARSTAVKAVWYSPTLAKMTQEKDESEVVDFANKLTSRLANYILTGKWEEDGE